MEAGLVALPVRYIRADALLADSSLLIGVRGTRVLKNSPTRDASPPLVLAFGARVWCLRRARAMLVNVQICRYINELTP